MKEKNRLKSYRNSIKTNLSNNWIAFLLVILGITTLSLYLHSFNTKSVNINSIWRNFMQRNITSNFKQLSKSNVFTDIQHLFDSPAISADNETEEYCSIQYRNSTEKTTACVIIRHHLETLLKKTYPRLLDSVKISHTQKAFQIASNFEYNIEPLSITPGLNYIFKASIQNKTELPVIVNNNEAWFQVKISDVYLNKNDEFNDIEEQMELLFYKDDIKWQRIQPLTDRYFENDNYVKLFTRDLKTWTHYNSNGYNLTTSPENAVIFKDSKCPENYHLINEYCWPSQGNLKVEVSDTFMESFLDTDGDGDLNSYSASVVMFKCFIDKSETGERDQELPYSRIHLYSHSDKTINITVNRLHKMQLLSKTVQTFKSNIQGVLEVDLASDVVDDIQYRVDFMNKWEPLQITDVLRRLHGIQPQDLQTLAPQHSQETLVAVVNAIQSALKPTFNGNPILANGKEYESRKVKRSIVTADEYLHAFKFDEDDDDQWILDFSSTNGHVEYHSRRKQQNTERALYKRGLIRDIFDNFNEEKEEAKEDISAIVNATATADKFLVEKVDNQNNPFGIAFSFFYETTKKIVRFIVNSVKAVVNFIKAILKRIGVSFSSVVEKVRGIFNFEDIQNTGRFLSHHLRNMVFTIDRVLAEREATVDTRLNETKKMLDEKFDEAIKRFGGDPVENMQKRDDNAANQNLSFKDARHSFVLNAFMGQLSPDNAANKNQSKVTEDSMNVARMVGIDTKQVTEEIVSQFNNSIPADKRQEFSEKLRSEMQVFDQGVTSMIFAKLLTFLKNTLDIAIVFLSKMHSVLTKYLTIIFSMFNRIMKYPIKLPFITKFFENKVMKGRARLNFYNLFALMGAVPATATYMYIQGKPPFTTEQVDILVGTDDMNNYLRNLVNARAISPQEIQNTATAISHSIGFVYVTTHILYSAVSFCNQLVWWPLRMLQGYFVGLLQYVLQITSLPFNWELEYNSPAFKIRNEVWAYSLFSFAFHKGNPTLYAFLVPPFFSALFQTVLAIPKLVLLVISLVTDLNGIEKSELVLDKEGRKAEAVFRYLAYTFSTLSTMLEWFIMPPNPGMIMWPPSQWHFDVKAFAYYFVFPPHTYLAATVAQSLLMCISTVLHITRLEISIASREPFLS